MRPRHVFLAVVALVAAGIGYLIWTFAAPRDLALVSTTVVDHRDSRAVREARARPGEVYALVTFDTAATLERVGHNSVYIYLFSTAYLCDKGDTPSGQVGADAPSTVFDEHGRQISTSQYDDKGGRIVPPDRGPGRHRYHVFVKIRPAAGADDLVREPKDLCVQILAHEMMVPDTYTNAVRVPAKVLRDAITSAGLNSSAS